MPSREGAEEKRRRLGRRTPAEPCPADGGRLPDDPTAYAFERFLYRLGVSELGDRFILKGAMLLRVWSDRPYRATRDLDLSRRGEGSAGAIRADLVEVCSLVVEPDGIVCDTSDMRLEPIRAEDEHAGTRVNLPARCGSARLPLQIDVGVGDPVWPLPRRREYPALLDFPAPDVLTYPREAVVAEKLEAMIVLGDRNSRIKDFFDLTLLGDHLRLRPHDACRGGATDPFPTGHAHSHRAADRPHRDVLGQPIAPGAGPCLRTARQAAGSG